LFPVGTPEQAMQDIKLYLEKLQIQAAECGMIRDLATDPKKRELFTKLAEHFMVLAAEVERALTASKSSPSSVSPPDACG
jgi:hypothetical protein